MVASNVNFGQATAQAVPVSRGGHVCPVLIMVAVGIPHDVGTPATIFSGTDAVDEESFLPHQSGDVAWRPHSPPAGHDRSYWLAKSNWQANMCRDVSVE